jgi:hypothetical protein
MADNLDTIGFSIQDTMDMGAGNAELINDLLAPETASATPEEVKPIIKEADPPSPPEPAKPKGKEIIPEGEEKTGESIISSFLGSGEDEEDDDDDAFVAPVKKPEETSDDDDTPQGTQFTALANDLFKLGVFTKEENEEDVSISTPEEFLERFNSEKKKGAVEMVENFIGQFGEDYQQAFDAIFVKGVNPKEYFGTYNQVASFAEMDLSIESNQEQVMRQTLTDQGFDPEDVDTEIERLKNYGDLEQVATKHHKVLVKKEAVKLQQMEQQAERELQQKSAIRNQYISNVQSIIQDKLKTKEFDGIPLNPKLAGELQDFLLVDKWKTASGETLTDFDRAILEMKKPENHSMKVKVALLLKILEKDPTLSTIQKTGVTKKSNELFGEVARQVTKSKSSTGSTGVKSSSWFSN